MGTNQSYNKALEKYTIHLQYANIIDEVLKIFEPDSAIYKMADKLKNDNSDKHKQKKYDIIHKAYKKYADIINDKYLNKQINEKIEYNDKKSGYIKLYSQYPIEYKYREEIATAIINTLGKHYNINMRYRINSRTGFLGFGMIV